MRDENKTFAIVKKGKIDFFRRALLPRITQMCKASARFVTQPNTHFVKTTYIQARIAQVLMG